MLQKTLPNTKINCIKTCKETKANIKELIFKGNKLYPKKQIVWNNPLFNPSNLLFKLIKYEPSQNTINTNTNALPLLEVG